MINEYHGEVVFNKHTKVCVEAKRRSAGYDITITIPAFFKSDYRRFAFTVDRSKSFDYIVYGDKDNKLKSGTAEDAVDVVKDYCSSEISYYIKDIITDFQRYATAI